MPATPPAAATSKAAQGRLQAVGAANTGSFSPLDWGLFSSISLIWGSSFLLISIGLDAIQPGLITLIRVGGGALALLVLARLRSTNTTPLAVEDRIKVALLSVMWVAIPFTLFPLAQERINSAVTGLLNGATPILAAVFGAALFAKRTGGRQLVGILIGFVGIVLIALPSFNEGSSQTAGVLMVLAATLCYGFSLNFSGPLLAKYGSLRLMSWVLSIATVLTAPFGLAEFGDSSFAWGPVIAVVVLGVVGTGLAYAIMGRLVERVGSTRASVITYLIPVVSLVLGVVFRSDTVAPLALVGVVIVIGGAVLASRSE